MKTRTMRAGGFREGTAGFESQLTGFLHARLRLVSLVLTVFGGVVVTVGLLLKAPVLGEVDEGRVVFLIPVMIFTAACLAINLSLRVNRPALRPLRALDATMTLALVATWVVVYEIGFEIGPVIIPALVAILLLARSIVVPSRARMTFLLGAAAPIAFLVIQLMHGELYAMPNTPFTPDRETARIIWDQVLLWSSVGMATLASQINFALRIQTYEATQLGQYVLLESIGKGGMGEVFKARHALLLRPTAVKIVRRDIGDEETIKRFEIEVRSTARLTHPNTIEIFDYGQTEGGIFYYAMELLDGADLADIVADTGPLPPARVIHILEQACGALHEAHAKGLIHRDIKASNLMLCEQGLVPDVVKLMDFGLVKDVKAEDPELTAVGEVMGTPSTLSPEAIKGEEVGPPADIYALAAVGCFLLTGRPIFDARTPLDYISQHVHVPPIPPSARGVDCPDDLEKALLQCLAKDPKDRPESALALRAMLRRCTDHGLWSQADAEAWWREYAS